MGIWRDDPRLRCWQPRPYQNHTSFACESTLITVRESTHLENLTKVEEGARKRGSEQKRDGEVV